VEVLEPGAVGHHDQRLQLRLLGVGHTADLVTRAHRTEPPARGHVDHPLPGVVAPDRLDHPGCDRREVKLALAVPPPAEHLDPLGKTVDDQRDDQRLAGDHVD
jgi:hypothetical protein